MQRLRTIAGPLGGAVVAVSLIAALLAPTAIGGKGGTWKKAAKKLKAAEKSEAKADYALALARSYTLPEGEREDFLDGAKEEYDDAKEIVNEAFKARLELADDLGETDLYSVEIDPADFVAGIDNPLLPFEVGNSWTYRSETEDVTEINVVTVLDETIEILGIECTVVHDTVSIDGELVEDTHDYYAQDEDGNVWYMGEIALNYEDGRLVDVEGSWMAGVDGAQPGIVMEAAPAVGDLYRQEFLLGEAEDYGEVLGLSESVSVPAGDFTGCLKTFDGTPIEPDVEEFKYYAPGVGVVLEENPEEGERVELIEMTLN